MTSRHFGFMIALILFIGIQRKTQAQSQNPIGWTYFSIPNLNISYKMPFRSFSKDTLNSHFSGCSYDSLISLMVNTVDSIVGPSSDSIFNSALYSQNGDTLRAILAGMILSSSATLIQLDTGIFSGTSIKFLEAGLELPSTDPVQIPLLFVRMFKIQEAFVCFTALGISTDLVRLETIKNQFYENIFP